MGIIVDSLGLIHILLTFGMFLIVCKLEHGR
jgi:hypothetical protein